MTRLSELSRKSSASETSLLGESEEDRVKKLSKHMLKGCLFVGSFKEKRFVEPLKAYRDVIHVSIDEDKFIENLIAVKKRCCKFYGTSTWIGITDPQTIGAPAGFNLWVSLSEEVFGNYWYRVKTVTFRNNEVALKLEIIKPFVDKDNFHEKYVQNSPSPSSSGINDDLFSLDTAEISKYMKSKLSELRIFFKELLSISNIKEAVIFLGLFLTTIITFGVHAFKYLLDYSLKFMHEFSGVIHACTPIILGCLRVITNVFLAFLTLIAYMWKSYKEPPLNLMHHNQAVMHNQPPAITYHDDWDYNSQRRRSSPRKGARYGSVEITPLDD